MTEAILQLVAKVGSANYGNNGRQFHFLVMAPVDNAKSQPTTNFSLFNQDADDTSRIRFGGQAEQFRFSFVLINDGTDRSNGTHSSQIITIPQQIQYLRDVIFDSNFESEWLFTDSTGKFYSSQIRVFIEDLRFNNAPANVSAVTGEITLTRGQVLTLTSIF